MNDSCSLCGENLSAAGEIIVDFGDWKLLLHPDSAVRGHAMLVIARHVENFTDLTDSEAQQFARVQRVAERALLNATGTDRAILLKLGIAVPHLHIHIYPVSRKLTRADVMRIINAEVSEERPPGFAKAVRDGILHLT
ncbi:MAG TPA: HIT domain-containing protein [Thermoanaerobaculia bacterium]|jgi:diadenosine tetraphosphate (Ap4A) HIT family hydrolase|nr:HIT domain-containing protein [Thermoanaerobaculia bacterium]